VRAVLAQLLPRVHSRLGIRRVNFHPYGMHEIATILNDRLGT
jgi:Cdc6-like AAA superfamily ATPase